MRVQVEHVYGAVVMTKLAYLAPITLLVAGLALAQNPVPTHGSRNCASTPSAPASQVGKAGQPQPPDSTAKLNCPDDAASEPAVSPSSMTTVPNTTIEDQPGQATGKTAHPGTMGTSGSSPEMSTPAKTSPGARQSPSGTSDVSSHSSSAVPSKAPPTTQRLSKPPHSPDPGTRPNPQAIEPDTSQTAAPPKNH